MPHAPRFRYDREGITRLLAQDTYDRDDVYMRELIANAIDSGSTIVNLTLIISADQDQETVYGVLCRDNGKGMTRRCLNDYFFRLARPYTQVEGERYGRFGIGVFTYLEVSCRVEILTGTKTRRGKRWHIAIEPPERLQNMDDVRVNHFSEAASTFSGTCVALIFRTPKTCQNVLSSLRHFVRWKLPAELKVRILRLTNPNMPDLLDLCGTPPAGEIVNQLRMTAPPNATPIPPCDLIEDGYIYILIYKTKKFCCLV